MKYLVWILYLDESEETIAVRRWEVGGGVIVLEVEGATTMIPLHRVASIRITDA